MSGTKRRLARCCDLSDWPEDLFRYELTRPEFGDPPAGPADLSANMRLGLSGIH